MSQVDRGGTRLVPHVAAGRWPFALAGLTSLAGLIALPGDAIAQGPCTNPVALFEAVKNSVQLVQASTAPPQPATRQVRVCAGDTIRVGDNSRAVILILASNTPLAIDQNSELIIPAAAEGPTSFVNLLRGALLYISRVRRATGVRTPFVNASIEGTEFLVRVSTDRSEITVFEGAVRAENPVGTVVVGPGQRAVAIQGQAPQIEVVVNPRDAVQWALYYEPIMPADSLDALAQIPDANRDARYYVRSAALLLGAGQLAEARTDIAQALKLEPNNADAYALQTVIAIALNDGDEALRSGRTAVEQAPRSASAHVALSYAFQAIFDLESAHAAAAQAVAVDSADGGAWARLAELRLANGDVNGAFDAARRATTLGPQDSRANTVLGFVLLARLDMSAAVNALQQAIDSEPSNPLARLGLGLTRIRAGQLEEGRRDIEVAAALNPENALIRSYLGKAYFEERREPLPGQQFDLAKQLDPRDPTPWLYDAIRKQTLNRPVNALSDLENSIIRNDNRAVFRSRLLLDEDLAARGSNLSRVYNDLGFEQLALVQGWRTLDIDPSNHSAHRLLADNYLTLPGHQIARDSELLQSQLLQPLSVNPVQPRLAVNDLNFIGDVGMSDVSLGEFTRMFAANDVRVVADGIVGTQATAADNIIVSGLSNRLSYSVGHFHLQSDGVREHHDISQTIWNAFTQVDLSPSTSILTEFRHSDADQGDRSLRFDPDFFDPQLKSNTTSPSLRLGFKQQFSSRSTVIGTYAYRTVDGDVMASGLRVLDEDSAHFVELRYLYRWRRAHVTTGYGHFQSAGINQVIFRSQPLPQTSLDVRHSNAYAYGVVNLPAHVALTGGVSADDLDHPLVGAHNQVNPKVGVIWAIRPKTVIRTAAFRTLVRTLVSGQTIEPTEVSGFNQFFDDAAGAEAWRYGLGVDQQLWANAFAGIEGTWRDLAVPAVDPRTRGIISGNMDERQVRAYFYSTISERFAAGGEYQGTRFYDPAGNNPLLLERSTTHKIPLQLRYFHPAGPLGRIGITYVKQDGVFRNRQFQLFTGNDEFVVTDLSAGYRLPRRWGIASIDIRNLFDRRFTFQDTRPTDPSIVPTRQVMGRLSITF